MSGRGNCGDSCGRAMLCDLEPRHIRRDLARYNPHPANNRLKTWPSFGRWCLDTGLVETDPAVTVRLRLTPRTEGHTPWTRADIKTFRDVWPILSAQRLAFELLHTTCASIGDATKLCPGMVRDGWLLYRGQKSGSTAACPMTMDAPAWFEPCDMLARSQPCLHGRGFPHLTSHGIRKHRGAVFKENGASADQRMAIMSPDPKQYQVIWSSIDRPLEGCRLSRPEIMCANASNSVKNVFKLFPCRSAIIHN